MALFVNRSLGARVAIFVQRRNRFGIVGQANYRNVNLHLGAEGVRLMVGCLSVRCQARRQFLSYHSPTIASGLFNVMALVAARFFRLYYRSNYRFQRHFLHHGIGARQRGIRRKSNDHRHHQTRSARGSGSNNVIRTVTRSPRPRNYRHGNWVNALRA